MTQVLNTPPGEAERDWNEAPLSDLIEHIVSVHHAYLRQEMPRLQKELEAVYAFHRERDAAILAPLPGLFFLMEQELELHMHREEYMIFPAIEELERAAAGGYGVSFAFGKLEYPIRTLLAEHDNAGGTLEAIRNTTRDYTLPEYACESYRKLFRGFQALERNMLAHVQLENDVLFRRALELEKGQAN